ncbi:M43 family zinc metalloprotease [Algoriphagus namhaensis]
MSSGKPKKLLAFCASLLLLFSCISEEESQRSFIFDQIDRIRITASDTVFLKGDETAKVKLFATYFDKNGQRLDLSLDIAPEVWVDGKFRKDGLLDTSKEGLFRLTAKLGNLESNPLNLSVVDIDTTTFLTRLEVDFSDSTRSNFAIAGKSRISFEVNALDYRGKRVPRPANIYLNGKEIQDPDRVLIEETGLIQVIAKWGDYESEALEIFSRPPFEKEEVTELPVIFHVVHNGEAIGNPKNRSAEDIYEELRKTNLRMRNQMPSPYVQSVNAQDAEIEFYPALIHENGERLAEPGIHRIQTEIRDFDYINEVTRAFMMEHIWDPNQYVNVFIMEIASGFSFAYFPTLRDPQFPDRDPGPLTYPYASVVSTRGFGTYVLAHELGHFLSLNHVFSEALVRPCADADSDLIGDTEHYVNIPENVQGWFRRKCDGTKFFSTNYMDYHAGPKNSFTLGQVQRMNFVLENAFYLPTRRNNARLSRFEKGPLDLTIQPVR